MNYSCQQAPPLSQGLVKKLRISPIHLTFYALFTPKASNQLTYPVRQLLEDVLL